MFKYKEIEEKWKLYWKENKQFETNINSNKPKYYILNMFPYPSGAGLHVGHPLGYISSSIFSLYKRMKGFEVLNPIGFDSFGLPAEQYAIQTGISPQESIEKNINRYKEQLFNLGLDFDWSKELRTSDPNYYKWTQWIFIQLFNSYYDEKDDKAKPIQNLIDEFEKEWWWHELNEKEKSDKLNEYRLAYYDKNKVNWCPELGTILSNDEVKNGYSERGGFPVEQKEISCWKLRITPYKKRLIQDLVHLDWNGGIKESQKNWLEQINDINFSRQRYWGEPIPIEWRNNISYSIENLPLELPIIDDFKPDKNGKSPLSKVKDWIYETDTMPAFAGSCWYSFRYLNPDNNVNFADYNDINKWLPVDLYVGGAEHTTGHLIYARFWTKFLYDLGLVSCNEPFQKLINQGMILGESKIIYKLKDENKFISFEKVQNKEDYIPIHISIDLAKNDVVNIDGFKEWFNDYKNAEFIYDNNFLCEIKIEKMSKSYHNVINPDDVCNEFGIDIFRLHLMFLGPIDINKHFNLEGIKGVQGFINKIEQCLEKIEYSELSEFELKLINKLIKEIEDGINLFSFNTCISSMMIFVNEIKKLDKINYLLIKEFILLLAPFAPHLCEEWWNKLGNKNSIFNENYPIFNEKYLIDDEINYPIQINGNKKLEIKIKKGLNKDDVKEIIMNDERIKSKIGDKEIKNFIYIKDKIINLVI